MPASTPKQTQAKNTSEPDPSSINDWILEAQAKVAADERARPWKQTFGDSIGCKYDGEKDIVTVHSLDDVQHNAGLAA